jgi:hypothetical protein
MIDALTETPEFHHWQWDLARQMRDAIEGVYSTAPDEVEAIKALVATVAAGTRVTSAAVAGTSIECESAFLHGPRSQVQFRVGNNTHQCELADLVLLGSYVEDGALRWQRACFVQAKRGSRPGVRSPSRFAVDKWQLALLRAFPRFTGVSGIFKGQSHHLRNRTGMLGAYGLLAAPGDLSLVRARILDQVLGGRGSLPAKELVPVVVGCRTYSETHWRRLLHHGHGLHLCGALNVEPPRWNPRKKNGGSIPGGALNAVTNRSLNSAEKGAFQPRL